MKKKKTCTNDEKTYDWWLIEEILPPDPWAYIIADFQWADEVIGKIKNHPFLQSNASIQHFPDFDSTHSEKIGFAFNIIEQTTDIVRDKINKKKIDIEFVRYWGEFQKALGILDTLSKEIERSEKIRLGARTKSKEHAKGWYALWYDHYRKTTGTKSRKEFDKYFEKILLEIKNSNRNVPSSVNEEALDNLINAFSPSQNGFNSENPQISDSCRQKKFNGKSLEKSLVNAQRQAEILPPIGEKHYPLVK